MPVDLPNVKQLVLNQPQDAAKFLYLKDLELWYQIPWVDDSGSSRLFKFPIPVEETAGAIFNAADRPSSFMRWINAHLDMLKKQGNQ